MGAEKPNIVYIMADDMGYGDVGCYGATKIPTPNMDRLAEQGIKFLDAHSPSAVCTPSRYSVITGRYCWRTRLKEWVLRGFDEPLIEPERMTIASMLKQQGYATAAVGKWHVGLHWETKDGTTPMLNGFNVDYSERISGGPRELGFDYFFGIAGSLDMRPYCFIENEHVVGTPPVEKNPYNPPQGEGLMSPGWRDEDVDPAFTQKAVDFLDQHHKKSKDQPFFLYMTPSAPHRPCVPPDFIKGKSEAGPRGDMVVMVDWVVGEITKKLEQLDAVDNTLIIVTSDNGACLTDYDSEDDYGHKSCGNWRGQKADIWEGGHRIPFIARWPKNIPAGKESDEVICLIDMFATCAELLDVTLPEDVAEDSFNILPALLDQNVKSPVRPPVVHHSCWGMFALRDQNHKLIAGRGSGGNSEPVREYLDPNNPKGQLYDMMNDPAESNNRWLEDGEVVAQLSGILREYKECGSSRQAEKAKLQ